MVFRHEVFHASYRGRPVPCPEDPRGPAARHALEESEIGPGSMPTSPVCGLPRQPIQVAIEQDVSSGSYASIAADRGAGRLLLGMIRDIDRGKRSRHRSVFPRKTGLRLPDARVPRGRIKRAIPRILRASGSHLTPRKAGSSLFLSRESSNRHSCYTGRFLGISIICRTALPLSLRDFAAASPTFGSP